MTPVFLRWCTIAGLSVACAAANAVTAGSTAGGHPYVSGGVGDTEQRRLIADSHQYSLWMITAARGSGAYLADAHLRVADTRGRTVFDGPLDGPFLMIDLPRGRYTVEATWGDQTVRRTVSIGRDDHDRMVLYFNVPGADVLQAPTG